MECIQQPSLYHRYTKQYREKKKIENPEWWETFVETRRRCARECMRRKYEAKRIAEGKPYKPQKRKEVVVV